MKPTYEKKTRAILRCPHCGQNVTARMTERQRETACVIADFSRQYDRRPTYREIGDAMGLSSLATVHKHVHALYRLGLLSEAV